MSARGAHGVAIVPAVLWLALLAVLPSPVVAQDVEEIISYDVAIEVMAGGAMVVTEQIRVRALGNEIRRGIFRDFPTTFPRGFGLGRIEAPFSVRSVTKNGAAEPFSLEAAGDGVGRGGVRVRIGQANVMLASGVYEYEIVYETDRWVRFGDTEDELYWNVTGNGWGFPIRSASARIRIEDVRAEPTLESWTGLEGSTVTNASARWNEGARTAEFQTGQGLARREGLTVRVTFPSGQLTPPTEAQQAQWFALDWGGYTDAAYIVLFVIAIYLLMWRRVGIDPARGQARLRSEPPPGYSPAALGYIESRGYEQSQLSAALVSMALKGALRIEKSGSTWTLRKIVDDPEGLSPEETRLFRGLLGKGSEIELERSRHGTLRSSIKQFRKSLSHRLEREYFENNRRWFAAGVTISVIGFAALAWRWRFDINPVAFFLGFWLTGWTAGTGTLAYRLSQQIRGALAMGGFVAWAGAGFMGLFAAPFFIAEVVVTGLLFTMMPSHLIFAAITIGGTNILFYHLLERPTLKGQGVLDELDGFRAWLEGSEPERSLPSGEADLSVFERYLPFAIALGLEERWTTAFAAVLEPVLSGAQVRDAMPWYHHDQRRFDSRSFASSLGTSLSSTLSANSSPPSSSGSGGGGGGGSSGGGGGGGGGGGW